MPPRNSQPRDHSAYGERDGKLLHISEVSRGLACGCVCATCKEPLIARQGKQRQHHFAHATPTECQGGAETILHRLTKELLSELPAFAIPPYKIVIEARTKRGKFISHRADVAKGGQVAIDQVQIEQRLGDIVPDLLLICKGKALIVEVAVTHKVDRPKLRKLRQVDVPAIEIQLGWADSMLSREDLKAKLRDDIHSKHWLFHPTQREAEGEFFRKLREARAAEVAELQRMREAFALKLQRSRQTSSQTNAHWEPFKPTLGEYDRRSEEFYRKHGRYPTMDECQKLWPQLWRK